MQTGKRGPVLGILSRSQAQAQSNSGSMSKSLLRSLSCVNPDRSIAPYTTVARCAWSNPASNIARSLATSTKQNAKKGHETPFKGKTPYEILGITKDATPKEIKMAYYKTAKQYHPDTAPADKQDSAREHFQMVAAAYELLSDPTKKSEYDRSTMWGAGSWKTGDSGEWQQKAQQSTASSSRGRGSGAAETPPWYEYQTAYQNQKQAEQMWGELFDYTVEGREVIEQAIRDYQEDITEELLWAADCVKRGDLASAAEVIKAHKGIFLAVGLPVAILLRFPVLIVTGVTLAIRFSSVLWLGAANVAFILRSSGMGKEIWQKIVSAARRRNEARRIKGSRKE